MSARPDPLDPVRRGPAGRKRLPRIAGLLRRCHLLAGTVGRWRQTTRGRGERRVRLRRLHRSRREPRRQDPLRGRDHRGQRLGAAVGPALADPVPHRSAYVGRLRRPAGLVDTRPRARAERRRRTDQPRLRPAVHPGDGPLPPDSARCARRCDLGCLPGRLDQPVGGDADHLELLEDIDNTTAAGFVFYTLDPKAEVDPEAEHADPATIKTKVEALDWSGLDPTSPPSPRPTSGGASTWSTRPSNWTRSRCCAPWPSTARPSPCHGHVPAPEEKGIDCEVEFAVDETDYPTKPAEHVVVVSELKRLGMDFISFAPRFVGRFEKGVEYIGDLDELKRTSRSTRTSPGPSGRTSCRCTPAPTSTRPIR